MEISKEIKWSRKVEQYLKRVGEEGACLAEMHKKSEKMFKNRSKWVDLPVIILSTVCGSLSIGTDSIFGADTELARQATIYIGGVNILIAVLKMVGMYFKYHDRSSRHGIAHSTYTTMYDFIRLMLSLPPRERMHASDMLKKIVEDCKITRSKAPDIPRNIIKEFKKEGRHTEVWVPHVANGLHAIDLYEPDSDLSESMEQPPPALPVLVRKSCRRPNNSQTSNTPSKQGTVSSSQVGTPQLV